jgi:hypothetical protein
MNETPETPFGPQPLARWYWAGAIASFLFMALGCVVYFLHVTTDPATLPVDERAAFVAIPAWVNGANALAVGAGLAGAILLLMRLKLAEQLMMLSLVGTAVWLGGLLLVPATRAALTANDLAVLIGIFAVVWTIFWFARHSRLRQWLS